MSYQQGELFSSDIPPWELDAASEVPSVSVVFPEAPFGPYDYRIPDELSGQIKPSMRVVVPLGKGNREIVGYVVSVQIAIQHSSTLKPIIRLVDHEPLCTGQIIELIRWMSLYYLVPLGQISKR